VTKLGVTARSPIPRSFYESNTAEKSNI